MAGLSLLLEREVGEIAPYVYFQITVKHLYKFLVEIRLILNQNEFLDNFVEKS